MGTIRLDMLTKVYPATRVAAGAAAAVDHFSLDIADGEFVALLGPSGCGKSTVLRMVAGLLEPTSGRVLLDGDDITYRPPKDRDLAMVFQSYALYPHLDVRANLAFGLEAHHVAGGAVTARVAEVAGQLGLDALLARRPKELSGGQRQRVAVGRAIARRPAAFLMDEPLSNLDARLRTATRRELVSLHRELQTTIIYVTHDQVEAMTMATTIVVMNEGCIEQVGSPVDVYDRPASTFVAGFLGAPPMNLLHAHIRSQDGFVVVEADGIHLTVAEGATPPREIVIGVRPEEVKIAGALRSADEPFASGTVELVENLGGEEIAYIAVGGQMVAVRSARGSGAREGDLPHLAIDPARVHLFDPVTGRRLRWSSAMSEPSPASLGAVA